mmetsp:Transcript_2079/g.2303  ORF Transcript_2079/g.2303 Transcript_2079/m.2303 type:complete len:342 (+) Transcript_2079:1778-2803(+)
MRDSSDDASSSTRDSMSSLSFTFSSFSATSADRSSFNFLVSSWRALFVSFSRSSSSAIFSACCSPSSRLARSDSHNFSSCAFSSAHPCVDSSVAPRVSEPSSNASNSPALAIGLVEAGLLVVALDTTGFVTLTASGVVVLEAGLPALATSGVFVLTPAALLTAGTSGVEVLDVAGLVAFGTSGVAGSDVASVDFGAGGDLVTAGDLTAGDLVVAGFVVVGLVAGDFEGVALVVALLVSVSSFAGVVFFLPDFGVSPVFDFVAASSTVFVFGVCRLSKLESPKSSKSQSSVARRAVTSPLPAPRLSSALAVKLSLSWLATSLVLDARGSTRSGEECDAAVSA